MDLTQNSEGEERLDSSVVSSVGQKGKVLETRENMEERRIGDKRQNGGQELLVPNVGKEMKAGPESRESRADGGGSVEQTKWAQLEFEDGQTVPMKNSVSTSFYIGRQPSTHEHYHQFHHEDGNLCLHISRAHCHILRLDTGSFSSYTLSLSRVLLILIKYLN